MKKLIKQLFVITMCTFMLSGCKETNTSSSTSEHYHILGQLISATEPTCTVDGMKAHYECEICGQLFDEYRRAVSMEELTIEKLGHLSGNTWFENDGYHYHLCERCGATIDIAQHTLHEEEAVPATHVHSGSFSHYQCDVCGMKFLDSLGKVRITHANTNPLGHDAELSYHPEVPATCVTNGTKAYYSCSCGAFFEDAEGKKPIENPAIIPALGHISNGIWKSDGNKHWHACFRCGEILDEENHTPGDEVFEDLNYTWRKCTCCGHKVDIHEREHVGCHHDHLMHYEKVNPTLSKPGHIEYYYCIDCQKCFYDAACNEVVPNTEYGVQDMRDGRYLSPITGMFSVLNSNLKDYLDANTDQQVVAALRDKSIQNQQAKKTILWEDNNNSPYCVEVSHTRSFDAFVRYETAINAFTFEGTLIPGETYYYRVKDASENLIVNDLSFKVDDSRSLRTITVDGVSNVRDLGGWTAKDGHKVQYGKLYRGAALSGITNKGINTFLDTLGVKTEIDLRGDSPSQDLSDPRLTYLNYPIWMYTTIIPDFTLTYPYGGPTVGFESFQIPNIKLIFETLADESNYPVYYHCAVGADRTGTISYLINGLLGVEFDDLTRDFEITSFSGAGDRYRSFVNEDDTFDSSGVYRNSDNNWMAWGKMNTVMKAFYGEDEKPLYFAIENYLKEVCDISDETIASVRRNLLGEDVDFSI